MDWYQMGRIVFVVYTNVKFSNQQSAALVSHSASLSTLGMPPMTPNTVQGYGTAGMCGGVLSSEMWIVGGTIDLRSINQNFIYGSGYYMTTNYN